MALKQTVRFYDDHAHILVEQYEGVPFEEVHGAWLEHLPCGAGRALDVGAGSGRDAAALARRGWRVWAVEPSPQMLALAKARHDGAGVEAWVESSLPGLEGLESPDGGFDLILASAMWMHVPHRERSRAFRKLVERLAPGGVMVLTLRTGPAPAGRVDLEVSPDEIDALVYGHALECVARFPSEDRLGRPGVGWWTMVLRAPDDGFGTMALFRHLVLNDAKSSTYKLALLRTLVRVADGAAGLVQRQTDGDVLVPMGLVALYWVRLFHKLFRGHPDGFRQHPQGPGRQGLVKAPFARLLEGVRPEDLRVGACVMTPEVVKVLGQALRDAAQTIRKMPAKHLTWPQPRAGRGARGLLACAGQEHAPIFEVQPPSRLNLRRFAGLDAVSLELFGTLKVPGKIWDVLGQMACWLEPAINLEWARLMKAYDAKADCVQTLDAYMAALEWEEPLRDTSEARVCASRLQLERGLLCVWTGRRLVSDFAVDHCLPFARWPNNDLWNLMPTSARVNSAKGDRLPSAELLERRRSDIEHWWSQAYGPKTHLHERFMHEAHASLPTVARPHRFDTSAVFDGLINQASRLRKTQQLRIWMG